MTIPVTRQLIASIKALLTKREPPPFHEVLKYDPRQARNPAGSRDGGRWSRDAGSQIQSGKELVAGYRNFQSIQAERSPGDARDRQVAGYTSVAPGMERSMGQANYADIMNAPTGEGFKNTPRGVNLPEPPARPEPVSTPALESGTVSSLNKKFSGGVNASYLVQMDDADGTRAVYKPEQGERWGGGFWNDDITRYITNKDLSLAEREAMASEVSRGLGFGDLVPETHLRESLHVDGIDYDSLGGGGSEGGGGYDSEYAREQYDAYKEKHQESVMEKVGEEMYSKFQEAQDEHAQDLENRAKEIDEIWNEEIKDFPDNPAGSHSALLEHPVLPLGSQAPFKRQESKGVLDPIAVLDDTEVDTTAPLNNREKDAIREHIREKLAEGYQELGDVNPEKAKEHLEYDKWREEHEDTENRLYESKIQTFDSWRHSHGYDSGDGYDGGGGGPANPDAPHPEGGSLQRYVPHLDSYGNMSHEDATKMAVLDYVLGTMDRHGGNLMYDNDRPVAIDNGYSMPGSRNPDGFTFRSVAVKEWLSDGDKAEDLSETIRKPIQDAMEQTDWQALVKRHPNMSPTERDAFLGRVGKMKRALSSPAGLHDLWQDLDLID